MAGSSPRSAATSRAKHLDPRRTEELCYASVHRAFPTGLLGNIGLKTESYECAGARGMKFSVFPGSGLFASKPQWLVAAELVQTTMSCTLAWWHGSSLSGWNDWQGIW